MEPFSVGLLVGLALGVAFRGLVAREFAALKSHVSAEVDKLKSKV